MGTQVERPRTNAVLRARARRRLVLAPVSQSLAALSLLFIGAVGLRGPSAPLVALGLAGGVAALLVLGRRRYRTAGITWLLLFPALLFTRAESPSAELGLTSALAAVLAMAAAFVLFRPRRTARDERDPLPSLPAGWVLLAASAVAIVDAGLVAVFGSSDVFGINASLVPLVLLFGVLALAPGGRAGAFLRVAGALLATLAAGSFLGWIGFGFRNGMLAHARVPGGPWILDAMAAMAFAAAFEWLRAAPSCRLRFARAAGLVLLMTLVPVLLLSPGALAHPSLILAAAARASAFGVALALAPRVAGKRASRPATVAWLGVPDALETWLVSAAYLLAALLAAGERAAWPPSPAVTAAFAAAGLVAVGLLVRARIVPLLVATGTGAVLALLLAPASLRGDAASLVVAALLGHALASPATAGHFVRRLRRSMTPLAVPAPALVPVCLAAVVAATLASSGARRLEGLHGPVPVEASIVRVTPLLAGKTDALRHAGSAIAIDPIGRGTWLVDDERDELVLLPPQGAERATRWDPLESTCRHASLSIL